MGLLDPDSLRALLRDAVRNRRIAQLAKAREKSRVLLAECEV